ncbi:uncharacterized protein TrAFT101_010749 [Trichoderma asperellum]|uniref:uncharacterized protein n=1 Tax=Trichoderma asperellum TaxID=101201 RepID=UPI00331E4215|nr:hypothetical protein TrAFT101_010749 [Trichoderma asperellum]
MAWFRSFNIAALVLFAYFVSSFYCHDDLGLKNGFINFTTSNFQFQLVSDSQVLASLKSIGSSFDFLPRDYLPRRARNGQYHWGDITYRFRTGLRRPG